MFKHSLIALTALSIAGSVGAAPLQISNLTGNWLSHTGGIDPVSAASTVVTQNRPGTGMDTLKWGSTTPGSAMLGGSMESYRFKPNHRSWTLDGTGVMALAAFFHNNNTIQPGAAITQADYELGLTANGSATTFALTFDHTEGSSADDVAVRPAAPTIPIAGGAWALTLLGFSADGGATFGWDLTTAQNERGWAVLFAQVAPVVGTRATLLVPEPATMALLGLGLVGVTSVRRRTRSVSKG